MTDVRKVADEADMIINGYAFTQSGEKCHVLNLRHPDKATVFSKNGEVLETSMDDIEIQIVKEYYFTSHCVIECMHVHASDRKLTEAGSAKFL